MSEERLKYKDLIGKKITKYEETSEDIIFYTDTEKITISKFVPYCVCNVGEYIDEITKDGKINGVITNIDENLKENYHCEMVYKGNVTFYFENGKLNLKVHGEDNGFYGVSFTMPVYIERVK